MTHILLWSKYHDTYRIVRWMYGCSPTKGDNAQSKKGRVVILVCDTSSHPVLHFYQVSLKYFEEYSSYRVDTKSFSNKTKGDNSKSKKAWTVNLVCNIIIYWSTSLPSIIKIFQRVFKLQSGQEVVHPSLWWGRGGGHNYQLNLSKLSWSIDL